MLIRREARARQRLLLQKVGVIPIPEAGVRGRLEPWKATRREASEAEGLPGDSDKGYKGCVGDGVKVPSDKATGKAGAKVLKYGGCCAPWRLQWVCLR